MVVMLTSVGVDCVGESSSWMDVSADTDVGSVKSFGLVVYHNLHSV